jgi:hypothetical protein
VIGRLGPTAGFFRVVTGQGREVQTSALSGRQGRCGDIEPLLLAEFLCADSVSFWCFQYPFESKPNKSRTQREEKEGQPAKH